MIAKPFPGGEMMGLRFMDIPLAVAKSFRETMDPFAQVSYKRAQTEATKHNTHLHTHALTHTFSLPVAIDTPFLTSRITSGIPYCMTNIRSPFIST